ncbi:MAG: DUF4139 domain-containing protein [Planctomycetes bacterium]|nr:DUF4139 domain-containing protein [Planctomycetota bacterium]
MTGLRNMIAGTMLLGPLALAAGAGEPADLPVTRVAVFSSGVAYFERETTVTGTATGELRFRTDQINDILKSLVVQDFDGGSVGTVGYASRDPIEKTLSSFGVDLTQKPTLGELLDQLRGEPVEIAGPRAMKGVIVGVEKIRTFVDKSVVEVDVLNVLSEGGIQQMRLSELQGVRLSEPKIAAELRKALETLATAHDADKKTVVLHFDGQGQRRVRVAYLLEAPIWKTSYRLVLSSEKEPFLQGWATVENATEEDWNDVRLSLVSGRPISFTMDLYTPIYVPRPEEELELYASLRPPDYHAGVAWDADAEEELKAGRKMILAERVPPSPARRRAGGRGGVAADAAAPAEVTMRGAFEALGDTGVASVATAQEAGELFEYAISTPVSVGRQHSAMLPIVNQEVAGEKVSIYNQSTHAKHPLNGLELENTTDLHLMQGPVTLFDGDTYAGDAKLPDLKPGEKRLLAYALDLGVEVISKSKSHPDQIVSLRIAKGTLWHRHKYVDERTYVIKNKDGKERRLILEQPYSDDWKLIEPQEPYERTQNLLRFKVSVPAQKTVSQKVHLERVLDQSVVLSNLGLDGIRLYLRSPAISPAVKQALERVVSLRTELDRTTRQRTELEKLVQETVSEQARVRENLKTLDRNSDPYARQLKKFDGLETQIEQQREQLATARQQEEQQRKAVEDYLLSLDVE